MPEQQQVAKVGDQLGRLDLNSSGYKGAATRAKCNSSGSRLPPPPPPPPVMIDSTVLRESVRLKRARQEKEQQLEKEKSAVFVPKYKIWSLDEVPDHYKVPQPKPWWKYRNDSYNSKPK